MTEQAQFLEEIKDLPQEEQVLILRTLNYANSRVSKYGTFRSSYAPLPFMMNQGGSWSVIEKE